MEPRSLQYRIEKYTKECGLAQIEISLTFNRKTYRLKFIGKLFTYYFHRGLIILSGWRE